MNLFGGLFFLLSAFYLSTSYFTSPEPYLQLPRSSVSVCIKIPEGISGIISIDKQKRLSFSFDEPYQSEIIKRIAARHGVHFTSAQLVDLNKMPFLSLDVRRLPEYFLLSVNQRSKINMLGIPSELNNDANDQLAECIATALSIIDEAKAKTPIFIIRADASLESYEVQRVISLLQQHNVNRIILATNLKMWKPTLTS
jgi:biopolymer transport protein ExbD